ncbi:hypothetical protein CI109_105970 [Kwoniella shandongensis]|uniref:Uncharacterized protein n=1 Tax=Kwoniella shandongensis TaxID=1734106 RepID=A0A5M6BYE6_9TREE|nr:uncharacterized protein CI109_003982 [Kwoniella shandongensis]KAA5527723.1 hypothetical protein CI109_003982 [Kwoniella shandongensis]
MAPSRGDGFASTSTSTSSSARSDAPTLAEQNTVADPIVPATVSDPPKPELYEERKSNSSERTISVNDDDDDDEQNGGGRRRSTHLDSSNLPPGCHFGEILSPSLNLTITHDETINEKKTTTEPVRIIWVDFPASSPQNPFHFTQKRKYAITAVATFFTLLTAMNVGAFSISEISMERDLNCGPIEAAAGLALFCWGFAIAPLMLAPLSEEFGRRWTYIVSVVIYLLGTLMTALSKNVATMLISRFIAGSAGSVGATLVGGTIADIYIPANRGLPSSIFAVMAIAGSGIGPLVFAWVESSPKLEWRWVWWIQMMIIGALIPFIFMAMRETRESVILRRRAKNLRKERGLIDGGRYTARSEVGKVGFLEAVKTSSTRPITFLFVEPVVLFMSLWVSVAWGVLYTQIGGLPYIFRRIYGFSTNQVGLVYITIIIGAFLGFGVNFAQDAIYRRRVEKDGVEARLYAPMFSGVTLALGCFLYGFTSSPTIHWIAPCIGLVIIIASIMTIYISCFVYLSECYGSYASSAIAAQSFLRNVFGGAFCFFIIQMYDGLTIRWTIFTWGCVSLVLAAVPFLAFFRGLQIRARSKYSKLLMQEEKERVEKEKEVLDGLG